MRPLPNLPRGYIGPNLKQALEIAIRDSLLSEEGMRLGYGEHNDVLRQTRRAENSYLFNALIQAAADTAEYTETDLEAFYKKYRNQYIQRVETEVWEILMSNPDSARALVKRIDGGLPFMLAAQTYTERDSVRDQNGYLGFVRSDSGPIGARASALPTGGLYGPILTEDGASIIRTGVRIPIYHPYEAIKTRVQQDANQAFYLELYQSLLPPEYHAEDVVVDAEVLSEAFGGDAGKYGHEF